MKSDKNCGWCKLPGNLFYDEDFSMWLCLDCCQKVESIAPREFFYLAKILTAEDHTFEVSGIIEAHTAKGAFKMAGEEIKKEAPDWSIVTIVKFEQVNNGEGE